MPNYATWEDYTDKYLLGREPQIPEHEFAYWAAKAGSLIDARTFGRLRDPVLLERHRDAAAGCVCELGELYASDEADESRGLISVSVTGHSKTFDKNALANAETEIINRRLAGTGLLYRGYP